jgi:hypothetical protein
MINPQSTNENFSQYYLNHRIDFDGYPMQFSENTLTNITNYQIDFNWTDWDNNMGAIFAGGSQSFLISSPNPVVANLVQYSAAYNQTILNFYTQIAEHLEMKGWIHKGYIYELDEPSYDQCVNYLGFCELVHQANPALRILLTTAPRPEISFLYGQINIWAPIENDALSHLTELKRLQSLGAEIVFYPCLFPKTPFANFNLYDPLVETTVMPWMVFRFGFNGFLYWGTTAYQFNKHGPGYNGWLDGILLYPDDPSQGLYYSGMRWDGLRDGFQDIEYFYILQNMQLQLNSTNPASPWIGRIQDLFNRIDTTVPDFTTFSRDPTVYYSIRDTAAQLIEQIENA